jgi:hypothetical protein
MADGTTINIEAQDTTFERSGTTTQQIAHTPSAEPQIQAVTGNGSGYTKLPFAPTARVGLTELSLLWPVPDYETPTTGLYDRTLNVAKAVAQSGPTAVRGGTARVGFAIAEATVLAAINRFREIWQAQVEWAKITMTSIEESNSINRAYDQQILTDHEQDIMAFHAGQQGLSNYLGQVNASNQAVIQAYTASRHYGTQTMITTEGLSGVGTQDGGGKNGFGTSNWQ